MSGISIAGLQATPLGPNYGFNWVFLVEELVCGILALFFLFYFNRLFATVVSYIIRAWTWHRYRAYIDITALQISLLGGRVFFKSIRYHGHNITLLVHDGHITWRYWLGAVQDADVFRNEENSGRGGEAGSTTRSRSRSKSKSQSGSKSETEGKTKPRSASIGKAETAGAKKKELPCRISVKVSGVEAFIYNRSPAYDMVLDAAMKKSKAGSGSGSDSERLFEGEEAASTSSPEDEKDRQQGYFGVAAERTETTTTRDTNTRCNPHGLELPAWLRALPVRVECKRAAAAVGNEHTTSVATAKVERAMGTIDAGRAGPLDFYKLLFDFELEKCVAQLKPNRDFKQKQMDAARRILREKEIKEEEQHRLHSRVFGMIHHAWQQGLRTFHRHKSATGSVKAASTKSIANDSVGGDQDQLPGESQWHGLSRYLDESENDEHSEWQGVEYAKSSTLVDSDKVGFRFYFDIPGRVQNSVNDIETLLAAGFNTEDINGALPPDYGMEFFVHGGFIVYGPWADRERVNLQHIFFPPSYVDAVPAKRLKVGDTRAWTVFKIYVSIEEDVVLRIPTRESSKDDQWQGRAEKFQVRPSREEEEEVKYGKRRRHQKKRRKATQGKPGIDVRPFGWLDITIKKDTTVNYIMDMFARSTGYRNSLDLDVKGTEMMSSVNHGLLWRAGHLTLDADLSYPIGWNKLKKWPFNVVCNDLELFILRDHFFLIIDIVNDWSSGPPPEFYTFVPYFYALNLEFRNWCMYLNVNDANIINDPSDLEKNDFLTLEGNTLLGKLGIPMEFYRPVRNEITWDVVSTEMRMRMLSPSRNTMNTLLKDKYVASLPKMTMTGGIDQHGDSKPGQTDLLRFDIWASGLELRAFGQLIRQFISLKENYFGDYIHFKTLEEFQHASEDLEDANAKTASLPHPETPNEMDVILCIVVEDTSVKLPTNLYSCHDWIQAELPLANLDLRINSYYLDMGLNLSPLSLLTGSLTEEDGESNTQIYVSHCDLYGHRTFGLPPNEPAYLSQWDIDIGTLTGECSGGFLHDLALASRVFIFAFQDKENALPVTSPNIFSDATFVRVQTDIIRLWLHIGKDALMFTTQPISVETHDLAGDHFSQRINVMAPLVTLACVDGRSASRHRMPEGRRWPVRTYAFIQTGAVVDVLMRKANFERERAMQQAHLRRSDQRTGRTPFLLRTKDLLPSDDSAVHEVKPPILPFPPIPLPLKRPGQFKRKPPSIRSMPSVVSEKSLATRNSCSSIRFSMKESGFLQKAVPELTSERSGDQSSISSARTGSSMSSPRRSFFPDDRERARFGLAPSTMAFSSPFAEPYFPLDLVEPDEANVPQFSSVPEVDDEFPETWSTSDVIEDPDMGQSMDKETDQTAIFIKISPGLRGYLEPRVGVMAAKLIKKLLPKSPEDVMDSFQMDVMAGVTKLIKAREGKPSLLEISASLPSAQLRVFNPGGKSSDQLDISIHGFQQMVRKKEWPSREGVCQSLALHSAVRRIGIMLKERHGSELTPAVTTRIEDILVWVSLAGNKSVHANVRDTHITISDLHANYLAQMALRLISLVDDLKMRFHIVFETPRKKLLCLIYTLTQQGEGVPDPPFLSRMTYILRAFHNHFRNQESWKVLARFRQMLDYIPENAKIDLSARFKARQFECPADAPTKVMESWGQWRNWDVPNVNDTLAFRMLFSQAEHRPMEEPDAKPLMLTISSEMVRLTVGNETVASQILVKEMSLGVDSTPPIKPTGLMLMEENKRRKTLFQLHTTLIDFLFNWAAFDMAKALMPMIDDFRKITKATGSSDSRGPSRIINDELERHDFHVVLSTDSGSISLQSINLRHVSRAERMKMSLIGTIQAGERYGKCASVIINADRAVTELHGHTRYIWQTLLTSPSLYIDHLHPAVVGQIEPSATIAIAYNDLNIVVTEQLPGILHIVDTVILDEVAAVMEIVKMASGESSTTRDGQNREQHVQSSSTDVQLNVAVLAGKLHIEVALLQSLSYRLDGTAASIRVTPRMGSTKGASIDFDMGRQSHGFVSLSKNETHHQNILALPPINGHSAFKISKEDISISVAASIEKIEIEAAAVQGIIGVVSKPEVQEIFKSVQNSVEEIKVHIMELDLSSTELKGNTVDGNRNTLFDIRFALLGIRVSANSSEMKKRANAGLEFGIGPLHATASNRGTVSGDNRLIPEVRAQIQDIGARLWVESQGKRDLCGDVAFGVKLHFNIYADKNGSIARDLTIQSNALEVNAYPETASTVIDVINHLQDKLRDLDLSREVEYLRRVRDSRKKTVIRTLKSKPITAVVSEQEEEQEAVFSATDLLSVKTLICLYNIRACWHVHQQFNAVHDGKPDDIVLTLSSIEFTTHSGHEARLSIKDTLLQLTKIPSSWRERSLNSALLPDMSFSVGFWTEEKNRSIAFKATGKPLDVRLESRFIIPVKALQNSIEFAIERVKKEAASWKSTPTSSGEPRQPLFDTKRLASLVIEADFAGARVYLQSSAEKQKSLGAMAAASQEHRTQHGRYGQFAAQGELMHTTLTAPGIALKVEYNNKHSAQPTLNGELRVDASTNRLLPNVVPLLLEVSNSVKEVMQNEDNPVTSKPSPSPDPESQMKASQKFFEEDSIVTADPSNVFGKTKVDLGLRVCRQEFGLSCQPIARIDAKATLDDFYFTMNTIASDDYGHFFAMSAIISSLSAQVKHVYSREPTFSYDTESIVISLMNSKHLSGINGISAIVKVNPTKLSVNAKQFQDLLLFREIWLPPEIRDASSIPSNAPSTRPDEYLVQRYQLAAAAAAFPWNATVSIAKLAIDMDLGQSLGRTSFAITDLWASQQKSSNFEQNLCIGLGEVAMDSIGRMSGFINLTNVGVRTSIKWPNDTKIEGRTPLIQASAGFGKLRAKAAFDYQSFAFGDVEGFDFLMYNVWENRLETKENDRLVAVLDCDKAYVFCTSTSPAQSLGLYQAFDRLIQEKQTAYVQSLRDIEKHIRRESAVVPTRFGPQIPGSPVKTKLHKESPISLHTDVVLTLGTICFGVYPSTFFDSQLLKLDANNIQARFAVGFERGKIHSGLGMTMGQLQVALAAVRRMTAVPKALEVSVDEVMSIATQAKGGVIVRVPKVVASMETWQVPNTNDVDYIFKSLFDGKIDVGWNLSRINFIKSMWTAHSRSLASRLGKPLPESAVKITAGSGSETAGDEKNAQDKITAEVHLPQSKYEYHALEPPIIETPQLRDMGEATPPLEWIGLHRDRLPNVTHQIILVSLLEVAKEVEDAYGRILGSS